MTAIQMLIENTEFARTMSKDKDWVSWDEVIEQMKEYLPIERQQIEEAYDAGNSDVYFGSLVEMDITGSDYFTKTYYNEY